MYKQRPMYCHQRTTRKARNDFGIFSKIFNQDRKQKGNKPCKT